MTNRYDAPDASCEALPDRQWYAGVQPETCPRLDDDHRYAHLPSAELVDWLRSKMSPDGR